ncbi:MAG: hypothetical protein ACYDHO_01400 [Gaiellaceae bacterium]
MRRWTERREVLALAGLVGLSFALRLLGGLGQPTAILVPDEYTYSELSRSLALDHAPLIRGAFAHFPSLAFPLLSAPLWAFGDPELVYKLTKALNALIASLAAVPVYLLARELRLRRVARLGVAALALAVPGLAMASYVSSDVLGYTLSVCALLAGVRALDRPTPRRLALFVALAALTCFARIQYVVMFPVFIAAWALLDSRQLLALLRRHLVACAAVVVVPVAVLLAVGLRGPLGFYGDVLDFSLRPLDTARWASINALVLAFAVGSAVVPGAVAGLAVSLAKPRRRLERAFSLFVLLFFLSLLFEAALFASNLTGEVEERYVFAILPALAAAFALAIERARLLALAVSAVAVAVLVAFLRFPLTAYDQPNQVVGSPFFRGVLWLQQRLGAGEAALLLTTVAAGLLLLGALAFFLPRFLLPVALVGAIAFAASFSTLATLQTNERSRAAARTYLPKDFDRIDDLVSSPVGMVVTAETPRPLANQLLFWNRSIGDPIMLPGSERVDTFKRRNATIAADGRLLVEGKPWRGPLLVTDYASRAQLRDARLLMHSLTSNLWQPRGEARFALMVGGLDFDGWLEAGSSATVWPDASGRLRGALEIELAPPPGVASARFSIETPWRSYNATLSSGSSRRFSIALHGNRPAAISVSSNRVGSSGDGRFLIAKAQFRLIENVH